ncbi:MAG: RNA 3'-terminal phosphate cyclase [Isosphaeraceae bacterium]
MERPPVLIEGIKGKRWSAHSAHAIETRGPWGVSVVAESREAWAPMVNSDLFEPMIKLDGARGEGGGQILRTALTLSLLTGRPFRIDRIRANRSKPGLRPQHLAAVQAAAKLGGATLKGAEIGSCFLSFTPLPDFEPRDLTIDIGTAGSTALILQTLALPIALRAKSGTRLSIVGGTFNTNAPSYPFLDSTWLAYQTAFGLTIGLKSPKAGFYPQGGGRLDAWIEPGLPVGWSSSDRGKLLRIRGVAGVAHLNFSIAERMRKQALDRLQKQALDVEIDMKTEEWSSAASQGAAISLTLEFERGIPATFVGLGALGKPAKDVADDAVNEAIEMLGSRGAVDLHSADQILVPLAFAEGPSVYTVSKVTEHLRTNVETIRFFLGRSIRVVEAEGNEPGRVEID